MNQVNEQQRNKKNGKYQGKNLSFKRIEVTDDLKKTLAAEKPKKIGKLSEPIEFSDCYLFPVGMIQMKKEGGTEGFNLDLAQIFADKHGVELKFLPLGDYFKEEMGLVEK